MSDDDYALPTCPVCGEQHVYVDIDMEGEGSGLFECDICGWTGEEPIYSDDDNVIKLDAYFEAMFAAPPDPVHEWVIDEICHALMIPEYVLTGIRYVNPYPEESE